MNIAILIPNLRMGGAERAVASLGSYYYERGYHVYYFLFADCGRIFFRGKGEIIKTHVQFPFSANGNAENIREMLLAAKVYKKLKKKYKIDIAVSFMEACNFINVCSKGKEKVFVSVRTVLSEATEFIWFLYDKRWIRALYKRADRVIAVSDYVKKDLSENYRIPVRKITTISNVAAFRKPIHGEANLWEYGRKAIVCVGRLAPVKQQERVIRAFSFVYKTMPDARLILVGDGRQKNYLQSVCRKMELEAGVVFAGASLDVGNFFQHARVFVMASKLEGFPNVMVEAMAYGIPVVTTDSPGGCGEIVGRTKSADAIQYCKYGILTPHIKGKAPERKELVREEKLLGEAMIRLLDDEELHKRYSAQSRKRAMDFSEENIMALWDQVLFGGKEKK